MARCPQCGTELGDPAPLACANCGYIFSMHSTPAGGPAPGTSGSDPAPGPSGGAADRICANCHTALTAVGDLSFRVGGYQGGSEFLLGQWGQLAEKLQPFSLYHCSNCGKVELWESGR